MELYFNTQLCLGETSGSQGINHVATLGVGVVKGFQAKETASAEVLSQEPALFSK